MKSLSILLIALFFSSGLFAYTWVAVGPDSINATNICFGLSNLTYGVICSDDGMYIYEDDMEWHHYTYGLPIIEAAWYSFEKILVVMGDGSWSDGIYTFDLTTNVFEVKEWLPNPGFIKFYQNGTETKYFAGRTDGGLLISSDGNTWYNVGYFDTIPCNSMDFYEDHLVICEGTYQINNLHLSPDGGTSWAGSVNGGYFSKVKFNYDGVLFASFPGVTNSSGIYKSYDFGSNWEVVNWEFGISCLGYDAWGNVFAGWDNGFGIAMLNPNILYPDFVFLNEGLPDTHVNEITMNPYMSAIVIFCCTNSGVYSSIDYMVGQIEMNNKSQDIDLFPNPVVAGNKVKIQGSGFDEIVSIDLYSGPGMFLKRMDFIHNPESVSFGTRGLTLGIYYVQVKSLEKTYTKKLLLK
ncbi:MAG: T9SS type A sorting domain-containing protein [Bacteroidales bacterium]|nr:T9SS type A sorting domain-containing protein [Bacteroidales bacterium]MCF8405323.1 T9SS type A sorting domain-containing protein [Bacteroidales bacterium]